ncbi:YhdP family phospholipid transporter [Thiolapillus sp.]
MLWGFFKRLMTQLTQLLYLIIIIGAVAKVLAFSFALYAENNKQTIEGWASAIAGTRVSFSRIETYWAGITPRLWVRQLTLGEKEKLALGDALVGLNLAALPHWKENLPLNIRLEGTHVQVRRDKDGNTRILGLLKPTGANLPAHIVMEDASIDILDEKRDARIQQDHLSVRLITRGTHSSLSIHSRQQGFQVRAEIDGAINKSDWSGTFWARGKELQTEELLQAYLPPGYLLSNLVLDFQAWSYWEKGQHQTTRLQLDLDNANLYTAHNEPVQITGLQGDLLYEKHGRDWKLQLKDFRIRTGDYRWKNTDMALLEQQKKLLLGISQLELRGILDLLPLLPPDSQPRTVLENISPSGMLSSIRANIDLDARAALPVLRAHFSQLSFQPWKKLPGVNNFSGNVLFQENRAQLNLDTQNAQLLFTDLFRQPLSVAALKGKIEWRKTTGDAWILQSDHLLADNADLQTVSRIRVEKTTDSAPIMDIQTDFRNGNGAHASLYYPTGIMGRKLVAWLDAAIVSGHVPHGSFLFHGPLAKGHFPFHKTHDGHFEVLFDVEDLELAYQAQWPPLQGTAASVRFHNNDLGIEADRARIYRTRVRRASASIASLKPLQPLLISGKTTGPMSDYLRLLRETPLQDTLAKRVRDLSVGGNAELQLQLAIPLPARKDKPPGFDLAIDFRSGASLLLKQQQLQLKNLRGQLKIDNQGLHADGIQATALGTDVLVSMKPIRHATLIEAQGTIPAQGLLQQYPQLAALGMQGKAYMNMQLEIPGLDAAEKEPTRLHITTDLKGLALKLPAPLGKKAGQAIPLRLDMHLGETNTATTVKYGKLLGITFKQDDRQEAELLAKIATLPVRSWLDHFGKHPSQDSASLTFRHIRLEAGKLDASPLLASSFLLDLHRSADLWKGQISSDSISGSVTFSNDLLTRPVVLSLDKLYLQSAEKASGEQPPGSTEKLLPGEFPAIRLTSKSLHLNQARLGSLELITRRQADSQVIEKLDIHGKLADIAVHGSWENSAGSATTWLKGVINTDNMGRLLRKALDMDFLSGSKTYLSFDLNWAGAAFQPNIGRLQGEAQLDMAKGRFLNFKPGLARILGLVNFDTLTRRLKLDFKDVYQQGMAFDTIMGNFQFDAGQMYTNNLEIVGPSASILISGSIDLINETYDQILSVSPRLDATLPVAGALAGGPAAGLVVLLAQQAFSEKLEKIQRITYNVSGSWDDPQITRRTAKKVEKIDTSILNQ